MTMSNTKDTALRQAIAPMLKPGEVIVHVAYGVRQPNMLLMLPAFILGIIPGVLLTARHTKHYIFALTNQRIVIARMPNKTWSMPNPNDGCEESLSIDLADLPAIKSKTKSGLLFVYVTVDSGREKVKAKFHRAYSKTNRPSAQAIAEALDAA